MSGTRLKARLGCLLSRGDAIPEVWGCVALEGRASQQWTPLASVVLAWVPCLAQPGRNALLHSSGSCAARTALVSAA